MTEPTELKLFSNQNADWLTEDKLFFETWKLMMIDILKRGHRIKIIHSTEHSSAEILSMTEGWIPMHLSGCLGSYFINQDIGNIF